MECSGLTGGACGGQRIRYDVTTGTMTVASASSGGGCDDDFGVEAPPHDTGSADCGCVYRAKVSASEHAVQSERKSNKIAFSS